MNALHGVLLGRLKFPLHLVRSWNTGQPYPALTFTLRSAVSTPLNAA